ncbi:MAG: glycosyltransferase family 2 protein [Candidatus Andersenbacteria bacterium]
MKLSAIVITKNESTTIARCLKSLSFADETIVVDAHSDDDTVARAEHCGGRVFTRTWAGYGQQKNFGAAQARGEWLLFIDADEEVTPALREVIQATLVAPKADFYWLRTVNIFLGQPLYHLYGHNPRLFKKGRGQWSARYVHEQVERFATPTTEKIVITLGDPYSRLLSEPLLHHSHPSIHSYLEKMHRYTSLDAQYMLTTHRHRSGRVITPSVMLPWTLAVRQFIKLLLYRRGLLDGWPGILWCSLSAYYEWEMGKKYLALKQQRP